MKTTQFTTPHPAGITAIQRQLSAPKSYPILDKKHRTRVTASFDCKEITKPQALNSTCVPITKPHALNSTCVSIFSLP